MKTRQVSELKEMAELVKERFTPSKNNSIPYLGLEHIEQGTLRISSIGKSSDVVSQKLKFKKNDILFGKLRPYFRKVVRPNFDGVCSTDIFVVRAKKGFSQSFLYYVMASNEFVNYSSQGSQGTKMPRASWDFLEKYEQYTPALDKQEKIGKILSNLDSKIENLQNQNKVLEQMIRSIFKSWFVDFDGVTEFEDSELGQIPKGWKIEKLQELCISIQNGGTPKRKESEYWENGTIEWYKTGELLDNFLLDSEEKISKIGLKNSSVHLWPENTILFAIYAFPVVGRMGILTKPGCSNQAASGLIPKKEIGTYFLFLSLVFTRSFLGRIATGAAQQNISQDILKKHTMILPPIEIISRFNSIITPIFEKIKTIQIQIESLTKTREVLLPKLISGEIRV